MLYFKINSFTIQIFSFILKLTYSFYKHCAAVTFFLRKHFICKISNKKISNVTILIFLVIFLGIGRKIKYVKYLKKYIFICKNSRTL